MKYPVSTCLRGERRAAPGRPAVAARDEATSCAREGLR